MISMKTAFHDHVILDSSYTESLPCNTTKKKIVWSQVNHTSPRNTIVACKHPKFNESQNERTNQSPSLIWSLHALTASSHLRFARVPHRLRAIVFPSRTRNEARLGPAPTKPFGNAFRETTVRVPQNREESGFQPNHTILA